MDEPGILRRRGLQVGAGRGAAPAGRSALPAAVGKLPFSPAAGRGAGGRGHGGHTCGRAGCGGGGGGRAALAGGGLAQGAGDAARAPALPGEPPAVWFSPPAVLRAGQRTGGTGVESLAGARRSGRLRRTLLNGGAGASSFPGRLWADFSAGVPKL